MIISCPGDKSITHRAIMLACMAQGHSVVRHPLDGQDCRSTANAFARLGCKIDWQGDSISIESPGWDNWSSPLEPLDFGNSGTTARLFTGLAAATPGLFFVGFGDHSLSKRPMGRVFEPLRSMGACIESRENRRLLPMAIIGQQLKATNHLIDKASAQVKSALILAALNCHGATVITLPAGARDHTEHMLKELGANINVEQADGHETIEVFGPYRPPAHTYVVPSDPSSAAFIVAAALLSRKPDLSIEIPNVMVNPTRTGFLHALKRMGAQVNQIPSERLCAEDCATLHVKTNQAKLSAIHLEAHEIPALIDEIPILAVVAAFADGISTFKGLSELRVKESDRLEETLAMLRAAGINASAGEQELTIAGVGIQNSVRAFHLNPKYDHRIAMAGAVLMSRAQGKSVLEDKECVVVSFPGFFTTLGKFSPEIAELARS